MENGKDIDLIVEVCVPTGGTKLHIRYGTFASKRGVAVDRNYLDAAGFAVMSGSYGTAPPLTATHTINQKL